MPEIWNILAIQKLSVSFLGQRLRFLQRGHCIIVTLLSGLREHCWNVCDFSWIFFSLRALYTHRTESMLASKKVIVTDSFILFHLLNSEKIHL